MLVWPRCQRQGTKGRAGPAEDRYAKVMLPLSDGKDITLARTRPTVVTERGVTWSGEVEETSERAVLMLWKDGHLSGYFGYKGRVFMVNHMGSNVHTMAEIDLRKLPPRTTRRTRPESPGSPRLATPPWRPANRRRRRPSRQLRHFPRPSGRRWKPRRSRSI